MVGRLRDWFLLVGSLAFVALGLVLLIRGDGLAAAALVALAFGWRRGFALIFTREGLAWPAIRGVGLATIHDQPVISVLVADPGARALRRIGRIRPIDLGRRSP